MLVIFTTNKNKNAWGAGDPSIKEIFDPDYFLDLLSGFEAQK
jgi:hypothetical protein